MFFMAVHATGREEAKDVYGGLSGYGSINRIGEGWVAGKGTILDGFVDSVLLVPGTAVVHDPLESS